MFVKNVIYELYRLRIEREFEDDITNKTPNSKHRGAFIKGWNTQIKPPSAEAEGFRQRAISPTFS